MKDHTVLPATKHEPYLSLLPSHRASSSFGRYSPCLTTEGWPGWVNLGGWLYWDNFRDKELTPDTVTHPSTNRAQRKPTSLCDNAVSIKSNRHQPTCSVHIFTQTKSVLTILNDGSRLTIFNMMDDGISLVFSAAINLQRDSNKLHSNTIRALLSHFAAIACTSMSDNVTEFQGKHSAAAFGFYLQISKFCSNSFWFQTQFWCWRR